MKHISKLQDISNIAPITENLDGWVVTDGTPTMKTWILSTSHDKSMISGYWEATPGSYHATYTDYEFVHIIAGKLIITEDGESPVALSAGDAFVVEPGFKGTWEIIESIRKHFDIKLN